MHKSKEPPSAAVLPDLKAQVVQRIVEEMEKEEEEEEAASNVGRMVIFLVSAQMKMVEREDSNSDPQEARVASSVVRRATLLGSAQIKMLGNSRDPPEARAASSVDKMGTLLGSAQIKMLDNNDPHEERVVSSAEKMAILLGSVRTEMETKVARGEETEAEVGVGTERSERDLLPLSMSLEKYVRRRGVCQLPSRPSQEIVGTELDRFLALHLLPEGRFEEVAPRRSRGRFGRNPPVKFRSEQ
jgi:hypothetical protein